MVLLCWDTKKGHKKLSAPQNDLRTELFVTTLKKVEGPVLVSSAHFFRTSTHFCRFRSSILRCGDSFVGYCAYRTQWCVHVHPRP